MGKAAVGWVEYPKYLPKHRVIVQSEAQEKALEEGRATVKVVLSEQGEIRTVESVKKGA